MLNILLRSVLYILTTLFDISRRRYWKWPSHSGLHFQASFHPYKSNFSTDFILLWHQASVDFCLRFESNELLGRLLVHGYTIKWSDLFCCVTRNLHRHNCKLYLKSVVLSFNVYERKFTSLESVRSALTVTNLSQSSFSFLV